MFFSEYYGIDSSVVEHYGAVDISFVYDIHCSLIQFLNMKITKKEIREVSTSVVLKK